MKSEISSLATLYLASSAISLSLQNESSFLCDLGLTGGLATSLCEPLRNSLSDLFSHQLLKAKEKYDIAIDKELYNAIKKAIRSSLHEVEVQIKEYEGLSTSPTSKLLHILSGQFKKVQLRQKPETKELRKVFKLIEKAIINESVIEKVIKRRYHLESKVDFPFRAETKIS